MELAEDISDESSDSQEDDSTSEEEQPRSQEQNEEQSEDEAGTEEAPAEENEAADDQMEQGETDGVNIQVPKGKSTLRIPPGILAPGTETQLEIAAVGANGNKTLVEIPFTTR